MNSFGDGYNVSKNVTNMESREEEEMVRMDYSDSKINKEDDYNSRNFTEHRHLAEISDHKDLRNYPGGVNELMSFSQFESLKSGF